MEHIAEIRGLLKAQEEAWNRGDLEGYMAGYWQDEQLRFASGERVSYGWKNTLEGYRQRYSREGMGQLKFTLLELELFNESSALLFGRWQLERESDAPAGLFTLILKRFAEGWRIVKDHTS